MMRDAMGNDQRQYEFCGFRVDAMSRQLFGPDGDAVPVTSKAFDVLMHLIRQHGRVVAKDVLLAEVWAGRVVEENSLTQTISALRKAFGVARGDHRFIVTVPRRGYRFVAPLSAAPVTERRGRVDTTEAAAAAERLYLAGRDLIDAPSQGRCKRAIGVFRQVLDIDPGHARAWSGMAFSWRGLSIVGDVDPRRAFHMATSAVKHALALTPDLPEAHAARAFNLFWGDWNWRDAEFACKQAINLGPRVPDGHYVYAHLCNNLGRFDEAFAQMCIALDLSPQTPLYNALQGQFLATAGRMDEAGARMAQALEVAPDFWVALMLQGDLALARGDPAAAVDILEHAAELSGRSSQVLAVLGPARVAAGDRAGAEALLDELDALAESTYVPGTSRAAVSNALGDEQKALDLLELAFEQRDVRMTFLKIDARWNNLRGHPRFEALMKRMDLPRQP